MLRIEILQDEIKAVAKAMAVKDIRYYLNGVCVETNGNDTILAASNGHMLAVVRCGGSGNLVTQKPTEYIIPAAMVQTIAKAKAPKGAQYPSVALTFDGCKVEAALPDGTSSIAQTVDGKFPDWRRIIPEGDLGETGAAHYNPDYLKAAAEAAALATGDKTGVYAFKQRGNKAAIMAAGPLVFAVMPMRESAPIPQQIGPYVMQSPAIQAAA